MLPTYPNYMHQNLSNFAVIEKNDQNTVKGLLWMNTGVCLTAGTTALAAISLSSLATSVLAPPMIVPTILFTAVATYPALKVTEYCFRNAIYHYGPQFEVTKLY